MQPLVKNLSTFAFLSAAFESKVSKVNVDFNQSINHLFA